MGDFFRLLFDTQDFPPRWHCGNWSGPLGWLHILSDLGIWLAYMGIPIGLAIVVVRRRADVPFPRLFWLFCAFIASCGVGHLIEAGIFWWPAYRLSGLVKAITAVISLTTMVVTIGAVSRALELPSVRGLIADLRSERDATAASLRSVRSEQERLRGAVQASGAGVWDWMVIDDVVTWDQATRVLFGLQPDERPQGIQSFRQLVHPEDRDRVARELDAALGAGATANQEFRIQRPDGSVRHALTAAAVIRDDQGKAIRLSGVILDVTDRAESQELFQNAVESAPCGMMLVAESGRILLANSHAGQLFGYSTQELIGRSIEEFVPAANRARHKDLRRDYFRDPSRRSMAAGRELTGLRRDGTEVPVEILLSPVHLASGPAVISTIVDVSPRMAAEAERRRYAEELERRNRALDEFAYLVSHDLKAPLRAISLVSTWLREDFGDKLGQEGTEHLETLVERTTKMNSLIQGALTYARAGREQGMLGDVDVGEVCREVQKMIVLPPGFTIETAGPLPQVHYDRDHLTKILLNLISNAAQHTDRPDGHIVVGAADRGEDHEVWVQDNGPGIDPAHHERVFRMFERLPNARGDSTGVGLAIVRMLVERHGGRVSLDSAPGKGATFRFTIPKSPLLQGTAVQSR